MELVAEDFSFLKLLCPSKGITEFIIFTSCILLVNIKYHGFQGKRSDIFFPQWGLYQFVLNLFT